MNDYTLSPVFNIRGKKIINETTEFLKLPKIGDDINYGDDYTIEGSGKIGDILEVTVKKGELQINAKNK